MLPVLVTTFEAIRLNCRPISPTAQVLFIIPQVSFERAKSNQAPTYHPIWLSLRPAPKGIPWHP